MGPARWSPRRPFLDSRTLALSPPPSALRPPLSSGYLARHVPALLFLCRIHPPPPLASARSPAVMDQKVPKKRKRSGAAGRGDGAQSKKRLKTGGEGVEPSAQVVYDTRVRVNLAATATPYPALSWRRGAARAFRPERSGLARRHLTPGFDEHALRGPRVRPSARTRFGRHHPRLTCARPLPSAAA